MSRPRDPALAAAVAAAVTCGHTPEQLARDLAKLGRACSIRHAQALLARARGPAPARPAPEVTGSRVWISAATVAELRDAALPGESITETIARLAAGASSWPA